MSKQNPIGWFELYVQDMPRAKKFYEAVFQVQLSPIEIPDANIEMYGFDQDMESYGSSGALIKVEGVPSGGGGTLVYFSCEDCGKTAERVEANGGSIHQNKMQVGEYGYICLVVDTEKNMIGLHSQQ